MPTLTESFVDSLAPNAAAVKNGWGLVKKQQFVTLNKSEDGTVLFGECQGSGKSNYVTSVDFINETPVARCTCPSRQFPCKHSLGLMYSYVSGANFSIAAIPEDILDKRSKAIERQEKKKEQTSTPKKVNKSALEKKIKAQIEGLNILELQIHQLVQSGLASIDTRKLKDLVETENQLGNYYLKEVQNEVREFILLWGRNLPEDKLYSFAFEKIQYLFTLCQKGKEHLQKRLANPELLPDIETSIEEKLGHIWQLSDLRERGLTKIDVRLAQLSFLSYRNEARKEFVDEGVWMDVDDGSLYYSKNYRPFRAAKQIKEEDSIFGVLRIKELFIYPGEINRRIRWEEYQFEGKPELDQILTHAKQNYADVIKQVRNQIRQPLTNPHPVEFVSFSKLGKVNDEWMIEGHDGNRITLTNGDGMEPGTIPLLRLIPPENDFQDGAVLLKFYQNNETGTLAAKPLTIITPHRIIRLLG